MAPNKFFYVLSPCGTSLLSNIADPDQKRKIFANANKQKKEIDPEDKNVIDQILAKAEEELMNADFPKAAKLSAELNGIIKIYQSYFPKRSDYHLLLSTDTYLGGETAKLVKNWLKAQDPELVVDDFKQHDLQTNHLETFQSSLSDLIKKLGEELPGFQKKGYRIIFNLTGGFKVVQGFLQSIAHFYADESVYIFETSPELLRIPKIPVKLDLMDSIIENLKEFRRLGQDLPCTTYEKIPETLLLVVDGQTELSPWGDLAWDQTKREIYMQKLWPSPSEKIKYSEGFQKDVASLESERKRNVNERIDQLAKHLETEGGANLNSLDFKPLRGKPIPPCTHECDAWADQDAKRMYGFFEKDIFVLQKLGKALH